MEHLALTVRMALTYCKQS